MQQDELDRILAREIVPSSGFVSGVMEVVRSEAAAPPPIPFPWARALPAILAAIAAILVALVKEAGQPQSAAAHSPGLLSQALSWGNQYGFNWIVLAILVTVVCASVSMRLVTGSWRTL